MDEIVRDLTLYADEYYECNQQRIDRLFLFFRWATVALAAEVILWAGFLAEG